ncbi:MAG: CBS domain-containing protein, partial [Candidatus Altiarchaeales archaeon HGW-Altiarchaeales-2]
MKVSEIMTKKVDVIKDNDLVTKARAIMRDKGFRAMPVVDKNNRMTGIIGRGDVLQITSAKSNLLVKGLMRHPVVGFEDEDINAIAKRMIDNSIKQIIIVDKKAQNKFLG